MKQGAIVFALLLYAVLGPGASSSHFRGGIIMVRPQPGGTPNEVGILLLIEI